MGAGRAQFLPLYLDRLVPLGGAPLLSPPGAVEVLVGVMEASLGVPSAL